MRTLSFVAITALAACQTPCPPAPQPVSARYLCADGYELTVSFSGAPERARVVQEGFVTVELPGRIVGAGYRYADGGAELRVHGAQVSWTRPGAAETTCRRIP